MAERVLVTGATGFVGSAVCADLVAAGARVRAMTHHQPSSVPGTEAVHGDLANPSSLALAVQGMDSVIHLAARVHVMRETAADPLSAFRSVNVDGTRALLREATTAGVARFVFASSVKAVAEASTTPLSSRSLPAPIDPYGVSKSEAEVLVGAARTSGFQTAILRLPLVYGPRMGGNMIRLFRLVDLGVPLPFAGLRNARSIVYVGNVAGAIRHLLSLPELPRVPMFVSDDEDLSTPALIKAIAVALGRPARLVPLPAPLFAAARSVADLAAQFGLPKAAPVLDRLASSLRVDGGELQAATGFRLPFSTEAGLRETAIWFRAGGTGPEAA